MMANLPIQLELMRSRRTSSLRYLIVCLVLILVGFLSMLAFPVWKMILILLSAPTLLAGYWGGVYGRNWVKEYLWERGVAPEDQELYSILLGIGGGLLGTVLLAVLQFGLVLLLKSMDIIS